MQILNCMYRVSIHLGPMDFQYDCLIKAIVTLSTTSLVQEISLLIPGSAKSFSVITNALHLVESQLIGIVLADTAPEAKFSTNIQPMPSTASLTMV